MGEPPLVSVVVPTHEREALLADAVESVARQTYDRIELLVVDDASATPAATVLDDRTPAGVEDVRVLRHAENRGANAARNTGVEAATGDYVAFLDDDDCWLPAKLRRQVTAFRRADDDVGVVFTGQFYVDGDGRVTNVSRPAGDVDFLSGLARGATFGQFSATMVRADVFDAVGRLDERFPGLQDREFYFRLAASFSHAVVPDPLTVRRVADHGRISDDYPALRDVACPLLLETHRPTVAEHRPSLEREFVASVDRILAATALSTGHYADAVQHSLGLLRRRPTALRPYLLLCLALGGDRPLAAVRAAKRFANRVRAGSPARPRPLTD